MANQQQLEALMHEAAGNWNTWRQAHLGVCLDLNEADLSNTSLCGVDLIRANLS